VLQAVLPVRQSQVPRDLLAGVTLAALAIPQALGYAKIAGMPVVTGLYTMLLPMAAFAVLGSSRHLVVAADSATAALLAAALTGLAAPRVTCLRSSGGPGRPAHRRAAAAGAAGPTRIPRQLPVADRPDRIPRRCWHPGRCNSVLVKSPSGHWHPIPVRPGARTEDGLAVYRFGTDLYYANAPRLADDVRALTGQGGPLRWVVLDSAAIGDVDYTAGSVLIQVIEQLHQRHIRFVVTSMLGPVRRQLDRYGVGGPSGPDAYFETPGEALEAFHAVQAPAEARPGQ